MIFPLSTILRLLPSVAQRLYRPSKALASSLSPVRGRRESSPPRVRTALRGRDSDRQYHVHLDIGAVPESHESSQTAPFSSESYRQAFAEAVAAQGYDIKRGSSFEKKARWVGSGAERLRLFSPVLQVDFAQAFDRIVPRTTDRLRPAIAPAQPNRSR
jgi:hypothetical protein